MVYAVSVLSVEVLVVDKNKPESTNGKDDWDDEYIVHNDAE